MVDWIIGIASFKVNSSLPACSRSDTNGAIASIYISWVLKAALSLVTGGSPQLLVEVRDIWSTLYPVCRIGHLRLPGFIIQLGSTGGL